MFFPELKESEDERIRKEIIEFLKIKLKLAEESEYITENLERWIAWLEKQVEQKPTDKVEPKFKVGDWVVWDKISCHIDNIYQGKESLMYTITDVYNTTRSYSVKGLDNNARLWTIQDAKDGDVLVWNDCGDEYIFVFDKLIKDYAHGFIGFNSYLGTIETKEGANQYYQLNELCPATKEQRNLLFQKMKEAGYEWDAEKKELKKIKKPTWSAEDTKLLNLSLENLTELKNRFGEKYGKVGDCINWLKSIKERCAWKPSDEQIQALLKLEEMHVLEHEKNQENAHLYMVIKSLKEQLWKLREE